MNFVATRSEVLNRGRPSGDFLTEQVEWGRTASDEIFTPTPTIGPSDIYNKVLPELGPWESLLHRKAVMLEVDRVLAGFESSWNFKEGVDTSRLGGDTPENSEAGAWQVSYDARLSSSELKDFLISKGITNGIRFQQVTKFDHSFAMEFVSRLMRINTKHNGPLYKGSERLAIRSSLRDPKHSIYPWLSRASVSEFQALLAA